MREAGCRGATPRRHFRAGQAPRGHRTWLAHFCCHFSVPGTGGAALWLSLFCSGHEAAARGLAAQGSRAESWGERGQGAAVWDERGALLLSLFCSGNGRGGSSAPWGRLSYEKQCELHSKH